LGFKVPAFDFTVAFAGPAFADTVTVFAGAGALAIGALLFIFHFLDIAVGKIFRTGYSFAAAFAERAFSGTLAVRTDAGLCMTERARLLFVPFAAFIHARITGKQRQRRERGEKVSSFHNRVLCLLKVFRLDTVGKLYTRRAYVI